MGNSFRFNSWDRDDKDGPIVDEYFKYGREYANREFMCQGKLFKVGTTGDGRYCCWPAYEKPSMSSRNVLKINVEDIRQNWGIKYEEDHEVHTDPMFCNPDSIITSGAVTITRNEEPFYRMEYGGVKAIVSALDIIDNVFKANWPIDWNAYDYKKDLLGKDILYIHYPAVIYDIDTTYIYFKYIGDEKYKDLVTAVWDSHEELDGMPICSFDLVLYKGQYYNKLNLNPPKHNRILENGMIDDRWWKFKEDKQDGDEQCKAN